jgi:DNA-binding CsgD family transcriptional regulator
MNQAPESRTFCCSKTPSFLKNDIQARSDMNSSVLRFEEHCPPQPDFAELCGRAILEGFAPAAVLIDDRRRRLYAMGPTHRYLRMPSGAPSQDLLAMADTDVRPALAAAIDAAVLAGTPVTAAGGSTVAEGRSVAYSIVVQPVASEGQSLMLVCFVDRPKEEPDAAMQTETLARLRVMQEQIGELLAFNCQLQKALIEERKAPPAGRVNPAPAADDGCETEWVAEERIADVRVAEERRAFARPEAASDPLTGLTPRQHQIARMVLAGHPSKNIAADLNISQRTVENHRASIMRKTGARSIPALVRMAMTGAAPALS